MRTPHPCTHHCSITHADGSRGGKVFTVVCLSVCLSVSLLIRMCDISKAAAAIIKLLIKCFTLSHGKPFWGQTVKGQGNEAQKSDSVGLCTLASAGFF